MSPKRVGWTPGSEIEPLFERCAQRAGGCRVVDWSNSPRPSGFSYFFEDVAVVAAVESLLKDPREGAALRDALDALQRRWAQSGFLPPPRRGVAPDSRELPPARARELLDVYRQRLGEDLRRLASQLEQTRAHLGRPHARGLLVLANEGNLPLSAADTLALLFHLAQDHHGPDHLEIVLLTLNVPARVPEAPAGAYLWIDAFLHRHAHIDQAFLQRLFSAWRATVAERSGPLLKVLRYSRPSVAQLERVELLHHWPDAAQPAKLRNAG